MPETQYTHYTHVQRGSTAITVAIAVTLGAAALMIGILASQPTMPTWAWATVIIPIAITIPILFIFSRMKVEVGRAELRWGFGTGSPRWSIPIAEIRNVAAVNNPWYFGIGIHLTPSGWLYNVGGSDAIEVTRTNGKRVRIGTDDVAGFLAALEAARR
jgi:hypothetical protein